jgi:hypothetical protein
MTEQMRESFTEAVFFTVMEVEPLRAINQEERTVNADTISNRR